MRTIGLYLHIPFCIRKCSYCDFYSLPSQDALLDRYTDALIRALASFSSCFPARADTVYFGGGTPSLMTPRRIGRILDAAARHFPLAPDSEITLELNPATVHSGDWADYRAAGVNRLSIGMQSGDDDELRTLGRLHTAADCAQAVASAQSAGFDNLSLDLMLGIPGQTPGSLRRTLSHIAALSPAHLSAYLLKIEPGTAFASLPARAFPDEEAQRQLYLTACEALEALGLMQYEISNFARPGRESRHNLKYWRCEEYLGLGPSAHSYYNGRRFFFPRDLDSFLTEPAWQDDGPGGDFEEFAMLRLRLTEGLTHEACRAHGGHGIPEAMLRRARPLADAGLLHLDASGIRLTREGFLVSNAVIVRLLG